MTKGHVFPFGFQPLEAASILGFKCLRQMNYPDAKAFI